LRSRSEELYEHVISEMQKPGAELAEAENVIMGVSHIDLGYLLARRWKLPELTVRVMLHHHEPEKSPPQFRKLSTLTYLVGVLTTALSVGSDGHVVIPSNRLTQDTWDDLELEITDLEPVCLELLESADAFPEFFKLLKESDAVAV